MAAASPSGMQLVSWFTRSEDWAETVFLPFVVLAELRAGFGLGRRGRENEAVLQRSLMKPGVEVLWPTEATTRI